MKRLLATAALLAVSFAASAQALVAGEVKKIDKPAGRITLKHAEIKAYDMPGMTGYHLGEAIRLRTEWRQPKLVLVSSVDQRMGAERGRGLFDAALVKPVRHQALIDCLARVAYKMPFKCRFVTRRPNI